MKVKEGNDDMIRFPALRIMVPSPYDNGSQHYGLILPKGNIPRIFTITRNLRNGYP